MEKICDIKQCSGCGACSGICPKEAITLEEVQNKTGHIYPIIDQSKCIDCGLCEKTCPANHPEVLKRPHKTLAAFANEDKVCNTSSSGGVAYLLGELVIKEGGVVYGSAMLYGEDLGAKHIRVETTSELRRLQGSKYVQSTIDREIYIKVKQDLNAGRLVLFTGTGCQVAGMRNYLKQDSPNFFAIDIVCHGVPSNQLLKDDLEQKLNLKSIVKLSFRDKTGFNLSGKVEGMKSEHNPKNFVYPLSKDFYMMGFLKALYYRDSCYTCPYAKPERGGDMTLGDFWGLKVPIGGPDRKSSGTSLVLVNTAKGEKLFSEISQRLTYGERPFKEAIAGNPQLRRPSKRHYAYSLFANLYPVLGFGITSRFCLIREKIFYGYLLPHKAKRIVRRRK